MSKMTPNRPYLIRAFYEWIVDNDLTPYVVVDATAPYCEVPQEFVKDGQIVLNLAPASVVQLEMDNADISFNARFSGVARSIRIPCQAVLAIYARENGAGTVFTAEEDGGDPEPPPPPKPENKGRPALKVVK